jgi:hypothetical protein
MGSTIGASVGKVGTILLLVVLAGCNRVETIYIVRDHPLPALTQTPSTDQITDAIAEAAQSVGWEVERVSPGQLRATQKWHDHAAIVMITNTDKAFSIRNDGSTNLKSSGDKIHKEYNSRVHKLEAAIEQRLQRP